MDKIVVGYDGSTGAKSALAWASDEARLRGAALHLVCAWSYPAAAVMPTYTVLPPVEEMESSTRAIVDHDLEEAGLGADTDPPVSSVHCVAHAPCPVVVVPAEDDEPAT
jgi:nucleotide-binding universal stress UspA family protein